MSAAKHRFDDPMARFVCQNYDKKDQAAEDIQMVTHLNEMNIETFADENNVRRSGQFTAGISIR